MWPIVLSIENNRLLQGQMVSLLIFVALLQLYMYLHENKLYLNLTLVCLIANFREISVPLHMWACAFRECGADEEMVSPLLSQ